MSGHDVTAEVTEVGEWFSIYHPMLLVAFKGPSCPALRDRTGIARAVPCWRRGRRGA
jgi:hypothetical protein